MLGVTTLPPVLPVAPTAVLIVGPGGGAIKVKIMNSLKIVIINIKIMV